MADEAQPSTIVVNPQAAWEQSVTAPTSTDTTKALAPEQKAQQAESDALTKDEIAGTAPRAALDTANAQIEADAAKNKEAIGAKTLQEKTAVDEQQMAKIAAKAEALRQAQEAIKATPAPALFADRKGWDRTKLAIGLALAGLGDAMNARNSAILHQERGPSAVSDIISMDLDRQKANLQKLSDQQIMAKEGVKDAIAAREMALSKVDMKGAALLGLAAQHAETLLKARGVEAPAIAQNELILKLRRDEETRKAAAVQGLTSEHTKASARTETTNRISDQQPGAPTGRVAMVKNPDGSDAGPAPSSAAETVNDETNKRLAVERAGRDYLAWARANPHANQLTDNKEYNKGKSLHAGLVAALGGVSSLGKSDESNKLEAERLGPTGDGLWSTQPALIAKILDENAKTGKSRIKLVAGTAIDKNAPTPTAPTAVTGPQGQTQPMVPPAAAPAPGPAAGLTPRTPNGPWTPKQREAARWLTENPKDPDAATVRKLLSLPALRTP